MILNNLEWLAIAARLLNLTEDRRLLWAGTPDESPTGEGVSMVFRTSVRSTTYVLGSVDSDGSHPFYLEIWQGDSIYDRVLSPSANRATTDESNDLRLTMRNLYQSAFRSYFGAPEKAEVLIADLDALGD